MSQFLETFATLCFPFGIFGCGIQIKKFDGKIEIFGSSDYVTTYFSFLLWTIEVASLATAAILSFLFASSIEFGEVEKQLNEDIVTNVNQAVTINMIVFIVRAGFMFIIYIINTFSCCTFECARCTSSYLFCGNVWFTTEKQSRNICLTLWLLLDQLLFLAPAYALYNMVIHNIGSVLSKNCLQMGETACHLDCAFNHMPWETPLNTTLKELYTTGTPDASVTFDECKSFAGLKWHVDGFQNDDRPTGCFYYTNNDRYYFNEKDTTISCTDAYQCLQKVEILQRPLLTIFAWMYILYFAAPIVRMLRQVLLYFCINTIVGNNATTHNSVSNEKEVVDDVIVTLLNQPSKPNSYYMGNNGYEKVYISPNINGLRKRGRRSPYDNF